MDKLKYVKLENPDGSYSESIPLAVDSDHVDVNGKTLTNEINSKATRSELNSNINNLQNEINGLASGSPLVASSINEMTDTTRTYVNTTDGYWYYYNINTFSWLAGGVYQTSENGDKFNILSDKIDLTNINIYDETMAISGYINANGIQTTTGTQKYAKVPITELTTYYLYKKSQNYLRTGDWFGFIDSTDTLFNITVYGDNIVQINENRYLEIKAPEGALYVIFNVKLSSYDDLSSTILYTKNTLANLNGYDKDLRDKIEILKNKYYINKLNKIYNYNYCIIKTGANEPPHYTYVNNSSSSKTYLDDEKKYYLYRKSQKYSVTGDTITYWNSSNTLIGYDLVTSLSKITLLNGEKCIEFTTPENTSYIRVNIHLTTYYDDTNGTIISEFPTEYEYLANDKVLREYVDENFVTKQPSLYNRLRNKKWLCLGDSITAATFRSTKNYHDYISERTGIIVTNLGHSGSGYIQQSNNICNIIDDLTGEEDFDYITIFAGTNDRSQTLGTFGSTDKTNIYGAINYAITELIDKFPNAKIGILTPLPRSTNYGVDSSQKLYQIANAEVEVAENYSIPVLNQYVSSGLRPWNATNNETFFSCEQAPTGDGLHPNELGHEWISYPIQQFLELM